jgi:small subunit ribosomal protein S3
VKVWIYKGDVAGTRTERAAQKAARNAAGGRARPTRTGRPGRTDTRPERGGRRRLEGAAEGTAPVEVGASAETPGQEG